MVMLEDTRRTFNRYKNSFKHNINIGISHLILMVREEEEFNQNKVNLIKKATQELIKIIEQLKEDKSKIKTLNELLNVLNKIKSFKDLENYTQDLIPYLRKIKSL